MPELASVQFVQGDFRDEEVFERLLGLLPERQVDVVLSDMAQNLSGVDVIDQPRSLHLAELALDMSQRVLKPGGEFLMLIVGTDFWVKFAFGPLMLHGTRDAQWWTARMQEAGFQVIEQGTRPAMRYFLARK